MGTSTLRFESMAPVADLGGLPDLDVDAHFWAAVDLMNDLLTEG